MTLPPAIYGFAVLGGLLVLPFSLMWQSGTMRAGRAIASITGMLVVAFVVIMPFTGLFLTGLYERLSGRAPVEPARG